MDTISRFEKLPPAVRFLLRVCGFLLGIFLGAFLVFQILFLMKVIPHGGI